MTCNNAGENRACALQFKTRGTGGFFLGESLRECDVDVVT